MKGQLQKTRKTHAAALMGLSLAPYPPLTMRQPHLSQVPRERRANLEYRARLLREGNSSKARAAELKKKASEDMLWYVNTFVWVHDPWITDGDRVIPLITRPYQDNLLEEFYWAVMRQYDLHVRKCRRVLATIGVLTVFDWFATYSRDMSFLEMSSKEELVDSVAGRKTGGHVSLEGKRSALMPKIDLIHRHLPTWLRPVTSRKKLYMGYNETGSQIEGIATAPSGAHGARYTAAHGDEIARWGNVIPGLDYLIMEAVRGACRCRILTSTPDGMNNAFYEIEDKEKTRKRRVFWWEDPIYREGIHVGKDGQLHSPWYDGEVNRCNSPEEKASQLDGEYTGSISQFFPHEIIEQRIKECRPPMYVGQWDHSDGEPIAFVKGNAGPLSLWCELPNGRPTPGEFVAGADIATGSADAQGRGYSFSVLSIYSIANSQKVCEYAASALFPYEFASACVALMRWLSAEKAEDVYHAWESGGPGKEYGATVVRLGWSNFYLREVEHKLGQPPTMEPGYSTATAGLKALLLGNYRAALKQGKIKNLSLPAVQECREFIRGTGDEIYHKAKGGGIARNRAIVRHPHGDRVIADALAWLALSKSAVEVKDKPREIPENCAYRRIEAFQDKSAAELAGEPTMNRRSYSWVA